MANVQVFRGGTVQEQMPTGARIQAQDYGENPLGHDLQVAAKTVANFADDQAEIQDIHDKAAVKEAVNGLTQHYTEIGYTGPNAYYSMQGKAAIDTRPQIDSSLDSWIDQTRASFTNENQRQMYDDAVIPQRQSWAAQIATHADKETKRYGAAESVSRQALIGEQVRLSYVQDPEEGERLIDTGLGEIDAGAKLDGSPPEAVALQKIKFTSGIYKDVGSRLAYEGGPDGPALAQAFVDKHGASMTSDDRDAVISHARVQQNALEAEQRRIEAEQRRVAREAQSDAKDRAQSAADNIDLAIPLSPQEYSSALSDARASGDDALVKRIETGQFKNNLTTQWNGVPPADLQSHINDLDSEITKAGGKVKPETVIERDHLQGLLNKSNAELNNDPLSWGAKHLGADPGRLNMDDRGSIQQRISAATEVSRRTGRRPVPLTNEEAAAWAPTLQHGSVADKVKLVTRLARFGPLAVTAAQQVAPNDTGFQNLVGLAGHSNAGVAASRVNQVLTGYEVLKTKPKLIDKTIAEAQFNTFIGHSLSFLPSVANGALSNAEALLGAESNQRGYSEWNEASPRWYAAVNSALGAYNNGGVQYGGLHGFNGGTTVLPEDMSGDDFDKRIARSMAPQFKAAHNGTPVYANGQSPTATEIKKMQWVPVRDGIYRLTPNGQDYVRTKHGDFYEIDIRKLR